MDHCAREPRLEGNAVALGVLMDTSICSERRRAIICSLGTGFPRGRTEPQLQPSQHLNLYARLLFIMQRHEKHWLRRSIPIKGETTGSAHADAGISLHLHGAMRISYYPGGYGLPKLD